MKRWVIGIVVAASLFLAIEFLTSYNQLVMLDQGVQARWAQVENVYQRRADLVPNLVATVKGAAAFEKETFTAVSEARARAGQALADAHAEGPVAPDARALRRIDEAQLGLGAALGRLLAVSERYPDLRATDAFRDLQAQLEGTENRITVERMRFNEAAQTFNARRQMFPTVLMAGFFGERFAAKPYFTAEPRAARAPEVKF